MMICKVVNRVSMDIIQGAREGTHPYRLQLMEMQEMVVTTHVVHGTQVCQWRISTMTSKPKGL